MTAVLFTLADLERANAAWGCNCGPAALAAICGLTLDEAREHFGAGWPGYTNPTMMLAAVRSAGRVRGCRSADWPTYGLARIQWEGPWMRPEVPAGARYKHTHWVGARRDRDGNVWPWDVNAFFYGERGWVPSLELWTLDIVPMLTASIKRASGGWHITHAIEVDRPTANGATHG